MYQLTCPACQNEHKIRYTRLGAVATCSACGEQFTVSETTMRQLSPAEELKPRLDVLPSVESDELPQTDHSSDDAFSGEEVNVDTTTGPEFEQNAIPSKGTIILLFTGLAIMATAYYLADVVPSADKADPSSVDTTQPPPSAHQSTEQPVTDAPTLQVFDEDRFLSERVPLQTGEPRPGDRSEDEMELEPVLSRIGISDSPEGRTIFSLAVRNPHDRIVVNPLFVVELVDSHGQIRNVWHCRIETAIAAGRMLELEAVVPEKSEPPHHGRIQLSVVAKSQPPLP